MPRRRSRAALAAALVGALAVSACGGTQPTGTPPTISPPAPTSASPTTQLTPVPGGSMASSPVAMSPATQTDTEWGRIWDALPPGFPLPEDAVPTETGEGPASASLAVGAAAPNVASFMQNALTGAGFSIESVEGPSEDGSFTINAVGPGAACEAQVRVRPLSGTTNLVVMYGAACPFE